MPVSLSACHIPILCVLDQELFVLLEIVWIVDLYLLFVGVRILPRISSAPCLSSGICSLPMPSLLVWTRWVA